MLQKPRRSRRSAWLVLRPPVRREPLQSGASPGRRSRGGASLEADGGALPLALTGAAGATWLKDGGDSEAGDPLGLRGGRGHLGAVGLPRLESGAEPAAALHRRRRRTLRCAGTLGADHTCNVRAGLLEDLVERAEVLPLCRHPLLCPLCGGILHIPGPGHHTASIPARPKELLPVVRLDLHLLQVGLPPQLILASVQKRVCGHQHSQ